jgi:hypothetical protein
MPPKKDTLELAQEILDDPAKDAETKRKAKICMDLLTTIRSNHAEMLKAGSFEEWKRRGKKEREMRETEEREKKEDEMAETIGRFAAEVLRALDAGDKNMAAQIAVEAKAAGVDPDTLRIVCKAMRAKR